MVRSTPRYRRGGRFAAPLELPRRSAIGVLAAGVAAAFLATATLANATATYESLYGYDRTWNAAVRLVRVDNGWKVTEKDDANGYLLFEYRSSEGIKSTPGSLELARGPSPTEPVRVVVRLSQMPRYHEQVLIDALAAKMRREYGPPPSPRPPPPGADAGADASEE
jgi:hypothetical protein